MANFHLEGHSSKHLARHSSKHLKLHHPGYTTALTSSPGYTGSAEGTETIPYDENYDPTLFGILEQRSVAAILAMNEGSALNSSVHAGHSSIGGSVYNVWGSAHAKGCIYTVTANSGAPFGAPICDLTITLSSTQYGITGTPILIVGSGASAPTGNPRLWSGTQVTASGVLADFSIAEYVWIAGWFTGAIDITYAAPQIEVSVVSALSFGSIRYQSA